MHWRVKRKRRQPVVISNSLFSSFKSLAALTLRNCLARNRNELIKWINLNIDIDFQISSNWYIDTEQLSLWESLPLFKIAMLYSLRNSFYETIEPCFNGNRKYLYLLIRWKCMFWSLFCLRSVCTIIIVAASLSC